jgi:putative FMN-dependent luciferase-like monooxygenase
MTRHGLGFFTRLLDRADPATRYEYAVEQVQRAEQAGFDSAWVAQHHFHEMEGGLPAPLVFLSHVAARTSRIRLGTGIITLPMEEPVRVAEDAVVLDILSGGRLELGFGSGGTPTSFLPFRTTFRERRKVYNEHLSVIDAALRDRALRDTEDRIYPPAGSLARRVWEATFSFDGGAAAGARGNGLLLSRLQPPGPDTAGMTFDEIQNAIIDAYLAALPPGVPPRILASRTAFVTDTTAEARRWAAEGLPSLRPMLARNGSTAADGDLDALIAATNTHLGTPDEVVASLSRDTAAARATDVTFQVHSVDPPHERILHHIDLLAREVAPALGWGRHLHGSSPSTVTAPDSGPMEP